MYMKNKKYKKYKKYKIKYKNIKNLYFERLCILFSKYKSIVSE